MAFDLSRQKRIAVTGIANSGKTVFLTSLLWQLHEFEDANFFLENNVKISGFREVRRNSTFPFYKFQDAMAKQGEWPRKTKDVHQYVGEFKRSDRARKQRVEFLDFPGERIADAAIAGYDDFGDWSDHMFDYFESDSGYRKAAHEFRRESELVLSEHESRYRSEAENGNRHPRQGLKRIRHQIRKGLDDVLSRRHGGCDHLRRQIVHGYRRVLARYALDCKPLISPSVFLLDRQGDAARPAPPDVLAEKRVCGLDASSEFAPLPKHLRETHPGLVREMQAHYQRYRRELVRPLFQNLADSQSMIVLVDIPSLLLGGVDRYNDNRQIVLDLFETMQGGSSIGSLLKQLRFWSPALQRIAFVATKADLVRKSDLRAGRLKSLLRSMNRRAKGLFPDAKMEWFDCSVCISTTQTEDDMLRGVPIQENPKRLPMEFEVSLLPEEWPSDWNRESYLFPSVFPHPPRNYQTPPRHRNLDAIFDFVAMY